MKGIKVSHKSTKLIVTACCGAALLSAGTLQANSINYSSTPGSAINFDGAGNFSFAPGLDSFVIDSGTAAGLLGDISGSFSLGTITTVGGVSSASVTGTGTFAIHDGLDDLTGTLAWVTIVQVGSGGVLNDSGTVNLTGVTYGGSNPDLLALAATGNATDVLTFQFTPAVSLTDLANSANSASFSGSISPADDLTGSDPVPDRNSTLTLLALAMSGLAVIRRKLLLPA